MIVIMLMMPWWWLWYDDAYILICVLSLCYSCPMRMGYPCAYAAMVMICVSYHMLMIVRWYDYTMIMITIVAMMTWYMICVQYPVSMAILCYTNNMPIITRMVMMPCIWLWLWWCVPYHALMTTPWYNYMLVVIPMVMLPWLCYACPRLCLCA